MHQHDESLNIAEQLLETIHGYDRAKIYALFRMVGELSGPVIKTYDEELIWTKPPEPSQNINEEMRAKFLGLVP